MLISIGELGGRLLLALLFIIEAVAKLADYDGASAYVSAHGLPALLLAPAIAVELGCGLAILFGLGTRYAAILLAGFCVVTAVIFHGSFATRNETIHFEKDLALAGAFLLVAIRGAGRLSLDARLGLS